MSIERSAKTLLSGAAANFSGARAVGRTAGVVVAVLAVLVILNRWAASYTPENVAAKL
jgi:hypothetical protein